jgi:hypothetical protein
LSEPENDLDAPEKSAQDRSPDETAEESDTDDSDDPGPSIH